jgi:arylsulfatase
VTIAEALRPAGYRNYAVGKWHVTRHTAADGPKHNWPLARGFDRYYGTIHGAGSFYDPSSLVRDDTMISAYADPEYRPQTYYYTDAIADHAVRFIGDHARDHADSPFFMYVAFTAAHWPMHALPEDIAKYEGKYDAGYEPIRQARLAKAARLGLVGVQQGMTPTAQSWDEVRHKDWEARCMEVYAAMIDRMDAGVGKIVAELKRTGRLDNTLIFYLQDNGGCAEPMGRTSNPQHPNIARPDKPTLPPLAPGEFITGGSVPAQTRDGFPVRMGPTVMPGPADTYVAYGRGWANVSNTPFREYKHWVHEGGISTPLIAHWPARIKDGGKLRSQPGHLVDIMATCLDVAGAKYPAEHAGEKITPAAGTSLLPALDGKPLDREAIYWEHEGNRAIRVGQWKLVAKGPGAKWELYDISADRTELNDMAAKEPQRVQELSAEVGSLGQAARGCCRGSGSPVPRRQRAQPAGRRHRLLSDRLAAVHRFAEHLHSPRRRVRRLARLLRPRQLAGHDARLRLVGPRPVVAAAGRDQGAVVVHPVRSSRFALHPRHQPGIRLHGHPPKRRWRPHLDRAQGRQERPPPGGRQIPLCPGAGRAARRPAVAGDGGRHGPGRLGNALPLLHDERA